MLNVFQFKGVVLVLPCQRLLQDGHIFSCSYCMRSSMSAKAALSLSAFLTSSDVTYGYSPYSKKLGHWCSRKNLMTADRFVFQSSGHPSRFTNTVVTPVLTNRATA